MRYLSQLNLKKYSGKICLLRIDLDIEDVDLRGFKNGSARITHLRIEAVIPTIKLLLKNKVKIVILSHRGRPKFKISKSEFLLSKQERMDFSLEIFSKILGSKLQKKVKFIPFTNNFDEISLTIKTSKNQVFLLENMRFWPGEGENNSEFARKLAILGNFYVNEAFGTSHRGNASISAITRFLPSYAGLHLEQEIKHLDAVMRGNKRPFTIILGGAKIEEKLGVVKYFWNKADYFLIGSSIINQKSKIKNQKYLHSPKIIFPIDAKAGRDIEPETIKKYSEIIKKSKTIIWNGPMGEFEKKKFAEGTKGIWRAILANKKAKVLIGGGETVASFKTLGFRRLGVRSNIMLKPNAYSLLPKNIFLSTGGGAMLDYLSDRKLPGIAALGNSKIKSQKSK